MKRYVHIALIAACLAIIPLLSSAFTTGSSSVFSIRNQNPSQIDIRFNLPQWQLNKLQDKSQQQKVSIPETPYLFIDEEETLPIFSTMIAIPNQGGVSLQVLGDTSNILSNIDLEHRQLIVRDIQERSGNLYPQMKVVISEPAIIRDVRIVTLNIYPFQYDPYAKELNVSEQLDIRLSYDDMPSVNELSTSSTLTKSFVDVYRGMILNYDSIVQRTNALGEPVILIIYANSSDTTYQAALNELMLLKKQRGYRVYSASTATAGTSNTQIKSYIQNAYNNWTDKPDYIILVGDIGGTFAVPTYYSSGSYGEGDYPYTHLAGADNLGDAYIGRISISSAVEFSTYVAKVMSLEKNVSLTDTTWIDKMLLVGDQSSSGISTVYTNQYIKNVSSEIHPDYNYTEIYAAPFSTAMTQALTQGVSVFNYRGYLGMSGWSPPSSPLNGYKLYHGVVITCATGSFAGNATTETMIRSGTSAGLGGAITAVGMATTATHTPMNNCLDVGIFHGIYPLGMRNMGAPVLVGKLYLNSIYGISNPSQAVFFAQICNLMGDPTVPIYVGIPKAFNPIHPSSLINGATNMEVVARNADNQVVPGAVLTLTNSGTLHLIQVADANGRVVFDLPTGLTGSVTVMVNHEGYKPYSSVVNISATGGLVLNGIIIDDDTNGNSNGNNNQVINPGETIEFKMYLKNTSTTLVTTASGEISTNDPYISMQVSRIGFGSIAVGASTANTSPARFYVSPDCPENHRVIFTASGSCTIGFWSAVIPVTIRAGSLVYDSHTAMGAAGNIINSGNSYNFTVSLTNTGFASLSGLNATLRSYETFVSVVDSLGSYNSISPSQTLANTGNTFNINVSGQAINGMVAPMQLILSNTGGFYQQIAFSITIGSVSLTDPLGQDQYGYFIFDDGDTEYTQCPVYNWIGIAPAEGGSGTALSLTDPGVSSDEGDQVGAVSIQTVNLPFAFTFYGRSYTQASISSNGFIAFGSTSNSDWRNWRLPGPGGPNPMVAVFWDDLQLNTGSYVYTYYNATQHYYVVEWYNVISGYDRVTPQTFQAILYDPVYYPTGSGDGQIKLQYKVFNNIDEGSGDSHPHGNYATIGIKDHNGTVGLEYTFNNQYPTAAKPLSNLSALLITTKPFISQNAHLNVEELLVFDSNEDGFLEAGESANLSVRLGNLGMSSAQNVSVTLSESSAYASLTNNQITYANIDGLSSGFGNSFATLSVATNCPDNHTIAISVSISCSTGSWNYPVYVTVHKPTVVEDNRIIDDATANNNGVLDPGESATLVYVLHNESAVDIQNVNVAFTESSPYLSFNPTSHLISYIPAGMKYQLRVPLTITASCPVGTSIPVSVAITSQNGSPASASWNLMIGLTTMTYDFEASNGSFVATNNPAPGWEWGTSTYSGAYSGTKVWGTVLAGQYGNNATYELVSPAFTITANSSLSFYHRYEIEPNYDGGQIQISTNNGQSWSLLTPTGGYPHNNLPALSGPGYHNVLNTWTQVTAPLNTYSGQTVKFKWLFKTDNSVTRNGWFIDNVSVSNTTGTSTSGRVNGTLYVNGQISGDQDALIKAGSYIVKPNTNGSYSMLLPAGSYTVEAIKSGCSTNQLNVNVVAGATVSNTNPQLQYLSIPQNLSWKVLGALVSLRWSPVSGTGFSGYNIYERKGTQAWQLVQNTTQTSYQRTVETNTFYSYRIHAVYNGFESLASQSINVNYQDQSNDVQPASPQSIDISRSGQQNTITWNPVTQDDLGNGISVWEYRIYAGSQPGFTCSQATLIGTSQTTSFVHNSPTDKIFYKVRAVLGFVEF